ALGDVHARRGRKEAAVRAFAAAAERGADDAAVWYNLALLQADAGDRDGYRRTCAAMLARFERAVEIEAAYRVALALGLQDGAPLRRGWGEGRRNGRIAAPSAASAACCTGRATPRAPSRHSPRPSA